MTEKQSVTDRLLGNEPREKEKLTLDKVGIKGLNIEEVTKRREAYKKLKTCMNELRRLKLTKTVSVPKLKDGKPTDETEEKEVNLTAEEIINNIINGETEVNDMLMDIAIPWGGAASSDWYAEAMIAWDGIATDCLNIASGIRDFVFIKQEKTEKEPERSKMSMVKMHHNTFVQRDFLKYAQRIYEFSWTRDDVANKAAVIVNQPPIQVGMQRDGLNKTPNPDENTYEG